jgi:hypothetical protein
MGPRLYYYVRGKINIHKQYTSIQRRAPENVFLSAEVLCLKALGWINVFAKPGNSDQVGKSG